MGYYVNISSANWTIEETPEALAAIREMPKKFHAIKRGGSSTGERWFSWMNDAAIEDAPTVESVFNALGFETTTDEDGKTFDVYGYDNKTGQEDLFLGYMAPFTADGSWIEWSGEDREFWQYTVKNGRMYYEQGVRSYKEAVPYEYTHIALVPVEGGESRWEHLGVDPIAPNVEELMKLAESWEQEKQAHHEKLRQEREAQSVTS